MAAAWTTTRPAAGWWVSTIRRHRSIGWSFGFSSFGLAWLPSGCVPSGSVSFVCSAVAHLLSGWSWTERRAYSALMTQNSAHISEYHRFHNFSKAWIWHRKHSDSIVVFDERGATSISLSFFVFIVLTGRQYNVNTFAPLRKKY